MPLPNPNDGETHDEWMDRCMGNPTMNSEYPDEDQRYKVCQGIWDDKDKDSKSNARPVERRILAAGDAELRVNNDGKPPHIVGYGARFNRDSEDIGFIERIKPGAFANALSKSDVRGLFNHDPNYVLGRVASGTMSLAENSRGLKYDITAPETSAGRDVAESVRRGDVTGSSFSFIVAEGGDEWTEKDGEYMRTITEFDELFDVGPVTFPAYPDTSVAVRSLERFKEGRTEEPPADPPADAPPPEEPPAAEAPAEDAPPAEPSAEQREEDALTQMQKNKQLLDEADARRREAARKRVDEAIAP